MMSLIVALVVKKSGGTSRDAVKSIAAAVKSIKSDGRALVVLPEFANVPALAAGGKVTPAALKGAEAADGPFLKALAKLAASAKLSFIAPFLEKDGGRFYSSAACVTPNGKISAAARRLHYPGDASQRAALHPGSELGPVFQTPAGAVGVLLGEDRLAFEGARILSVRGAQILACPSATSIQPGNTFDVMLRAHAVANQVYVAGVLTGKKSQCLIIDVRGQVAGRGRSAAMADADLARIREVRNVWQFFRDRRPETYSVIAGGADETVVTH